MGTENKESKAEETRPARAAAPEEESGKAATLVEGSRSSKLGFGADARTYEGKGSKEKKQQQKRKQQSATVRRAAPQQPLLSAPGNPQTQQIETAYALSLGFLGILIFVEGIILAASGLSCILSLSLSLSLSFPCFAMRNEVRICLSPICKRKNQDGEKKKKSDLVSLSVLQSCQDDDVRIGYTHHFW
jgi:hypothetical protein